jgi:hypothetical protein
MKLLSVDMDCCPREKRILHLEVTIDIIRPGEVEVSNLVELIRIDNNTATYVHDKFTQCWLCCYARLVCYVHDK